MPPTKGTVVVACAGSGKTRSIAEWALNCPGKRVLVTTYTNENVDQINSYLIRLNGHIPPNITVMSWYSFLLQDGVRPYQNAVVSCGRIGTIDFLGVPNLYIAKKNAHSYYLNRNNDIYRDRVADFVCECDTKSGGWVIQRLEKIYDRIYIDEMQDLAGYDLELLERLFGSRVVTVAVGDPRQATFSTNLAAKNRKYNRGGIMDWIDSKRTCGLFVVEEKVHCHRSNQAICNFADALYPTLPKTISKNFDVTGHDGVFSKKREEIATYCREYEPVVLRYDKRTDTHGLRAFNIGAMKGRTFDRVLIFPTGPMKKYLASKDVGEAGDLAKFYVAVTRARHSVAFVV
jgi:hypothetical protein